MRVPMVVYTSIEMEPLHSPHPPACHLIARSSPSLPLTHSYHSSTTMFNQAAWFDQPNKAANTRVAPMPSIKDDEVLVKVACAFALPLHGSFKQKYRHHRRTWRHCSSCRHDPFLSSAYDRRCAVLLRSHRLY